MSKLNRRLVIDAGFEEEVKSVEEGICPFCKAFIEYNEFSDNVSKKEYGISGLCQKCQNGFFSDSPSSEFCTDKRERYITVTRAKNTVFFI